MANPPAEDDVTYSNDPNAWAVAAGRPAPTPMASAPKPSGDFWIGTSSVTPSQEAEYREGQYKQLRSSGFTEEEARAKSGFMPPAAQAAAPATPGGIVFAQQPGGLGNMQLTMPVYVPAHERRLVSPQRQQEEQNAYEGQREAIAGENAAIGGVQDAERNLAQAQGGVSAATAQGWAGVAERADKAAQEAEARQKNSGKSFDDWQKKMDAFSEALSKQEVDPNRLWNNASTGSKITWSLARVLGGLAQGMMRTPTNQVADQIEARIRADVDAQKANYQVKRGRLSDMENLWTLARQHTNDDNQTHALAVNYGMEAAKARINQLVSAAGTPVAAAYGEKLAAELGVKQAENTERSAATHTQAVQRGIAENPFVEGGYAGGGGGKTDFKNVFFDPNSGQYYEARSEDDKKQLSKATQLVGRIRAASDRYTQALKNLNAAEKLAGKVDMDSDAMSEARAAHIALLDDVREANTEGGVIREGLIKSGVYEHSILSPTQLTGNPAKQMDVINDRVKNLQRNVMETLAPIPVVSVPQPVGSRPKTVPTGQNRENPSPVPGTFQAAGAKASGGAVYAGAREGGGMVDPFQADEGLHMTDDGRAFYAIEAPPPTASLSGPMPQYAVANPVSYEAGVAAGRAAVEPNPGAYKAGADAGRAASKAKTAPKQRKMTPEEMNAEADRLIAATQAQKEAALAEGPAVKRLAAGTPSTNYETELTEGAKPGYEVWRARVAPGDPGLDYDYAGAYAAGEGRGSSGHMTDEFKKPNHPTFSDESMYARYEPGSAGSWNGETYVPAKGASPVWLRQYMAQADQDGVLRPSEAQYMAQYVPAREDGGPVKGSDEKAALRRAYLLGRAHSMEQFTTGQAVPFAYGGAPRKGEELVDDDPTAPRFRRVPVPGAAAGKLERADLDQPMPERLSMVAPAAPPAMVAVSGSQPVPVVVPKRGALSPPTVEESRSLQGPSEVIVPAPTPAPAPAPVQARTPVVVMKPAPAQPGLFTRVGNTARNVAGKVGNAAVAAKDYVDSGLGRVGQGIADTAGDVVEFVAPSPSVAQQAPPAPPRYAPPTAAQYSGYLPTDEAKNQASYASGGAIRGAEHPMAKVSAIRRFAEKSKKKA